jgi:signal transduction histidine kinase
MNEWLRVTAILATIFLPLTSPCQKAKNILVLHMEGPRLPANIVAAKAIQETIGQDLGYQLFDEYIEETRLETDFPTLAERLRQKYAGQRIDLLLTVGPRPFTFLREYGEQLFPSVPIVFSEVDLRYYPPQLPPNTTGVSGSFLPNLSRTVDLILRLQPDTREIFYIGGSTSNELLFREGAKREFEPYAGRLAVTYLNDLPLAPLLDRIGQLPSHSVILFTTFYRDASGQTYLTANICPTVVASSNALVYAIYDTVIGCGIIGGSLFQVEASARQAAKLALRILHGESVAKLPVEPGPPDQVVVDWRQLQKWHIPEKRLPPGTVVMYRVPSAWEAHKKLLLAAATILLIQSSLIVLLAIQTRRRKRSERAVRQLTRRVIDASENESRHIARELHDDIGQRLSLALVELDLFGRQLPSDAVKNRTDLDSSIQILNSLVSDVHNLSHRLHSSQLEHVGLEAAIAELCRQISNSYGVEIDFQVDAAPGGLARDVSLCFYRVAQEALNNVVKHSKTNKAQLTLTEEPGLLWMQIRDSGVGFKVADAAVGLGLSAMQERVESLGGILSVESVPSVGTLVIAEAPIPVRNETQNGKL